MMKRKGAMGSPCRSPCLIGNSLVGEPFTMTEALPEFKRPRIHWRCLSGNPKVFKTVRRKFQFNVSYAFSKSTLKTISFFFDFFAQDMISLIMRDPSVMFRPPTKAD
ncbi:hypothetical protein HanIR_Chr07g0339371 [Helianthus annuus]|nr:hypothetical protein HanIR_Chr07g0339371 [Helianthus annuus]